MQKKVVGLKYDAESAKGAPQVIVKGIGEGAEEILRCRHPVHGPRVIKNDALVERLYRLPIDAEIGKELYHVVAILLAHIFLVEEKAKRGDEE